MKLGSVLSVADQFKLPWEPQEKEETIFGLNYKNRVLAFVASLVLGILLCGLVIVRTKELNPFSSSLSN